MSGPVWLRRRGEARGGARLACRRGRKKRASLATTLSHSPPGTPASNAAQGSGLLSNRCHSLLWKAKDPVAWLDVVVKSRKMRLELTMTG